MTLLTSTQRIIRISLAGGLALGLATLAGCGVGSPAPGVSSGPVPLALSGRVHGGQQPISGANIQLWTVGTTGYGSQGTNLLGSHVVTSGPDGSFSITGDYTCPIGDTLVYLLASGGNPGLASGTNNTAIELAAPLGSCNALSTNLPFIFVDEVTTAATAVALGQYFTTTFGSSSQDSFGTNNTTQAQVGLANAFATVNNLVDTTKGIALTSVPLTGAAGTITATPEAAKLNTIADILAACVNSDGGASSPCQTTLFPDVAPLGKAAPTDTLQAAVYMTLNPTSNNANGSAANLAALYALQTPQSPFVGGTQPTDWTIGILYSGTAAQTNTLINDVLDIRADASGNIWFINGSGTAASEAMTELSPTGVPLVNAFAGTASPTGMSGSTPRNLAIDLNGNAWATSSSGSSTLYQYNPNTSSGTSLNVGGQGYGIAVDGSNNVFISHNSTTAAESLDQFTSGVLAATNRIEYPLDGGSASNDLATYSVVDTLGNVWHSSGVAGATSVIQVSGMNGVATCTTFPCTTTNDTSLTATYTPVSGGTILGPFSMAAGATSVWVADSGSGANSITKLALTGGTGTNFGSSTSLNSPHYIAVDGSGNVWVANKTSAPGSVSELTDSGTILSPQSGGTAPFNILGFSHAGIASAEGITIDPSGNVWIANNSGTAANSVFEIVGAASPTVTPIALALKNSAIGQKP